MAKFGKGDVLGPDASPEDILDYFLAISTGLTPEEMIRLWRNMPVNRNTHLISACCVGASMNIKDKVDETTKKMNLTLPEAIKIGDTISMTFFAMTGHVIMMVPEGNLTKRGLKLKKGYQKSIGGVEDITKFHSGVQMGNKEKRAEILLKWNASLRNFNVIPYIDLLASVCPAMVKPRSNIFTRFFRWLGSLITSPFRWVWRVLSSLFSTAKSVSQSLSAIVVTLLVVRLVAFAIFPKTVDTILVGLGTNMTVGAEDDAGTRIITALTGAPAFGASIGLSTVSLLLGGAGELASSVFFPDGAIPRAISFALDFFRYSPEERADFLDSLDYGEIIGGTKNATVDSLKAAAKATIRAYLGEEALPEGMELPEGLMSLVRGNATEDLKGLKPLAYSIAEGAKTAMDWARGETAPKDTVEAETSAGEIGSGKGEKKTTAVKEENKKK
jgi:hypothetical protein